MKTSRIATALLVATTLGGAYYLLHSPSSGDNASDSGRAEGPPGAQASSGVGSQTVSNGTSNTAGGATTGAGERRGDRLSAAQLLGHLGNESFPKSKETSRFIWDAIGRLRLQPELSEQVASIALGDTATYAQQEMSLDLLAHAGHREAQAAMLRVLGQLPIDDVRRYGPLLQRISFVKEPNNETVAFIEERANGTSAVDPEIRRSALFTAGALAKNMRLTGRIASATSMQNVLLAQLQQAKAPADQSAALGGLGNSENTDSVAEILSYTTHTDSSVRFAAARALGHFDSDDATARLCEMVNGPSTMVQHEALRSLVPRTLNAVQTAQLVTAVGTQLGAANRPLMVTVLGRNRGLAASRQGLQELLALSSGDARLRGRIRNMLGR